MIASRRRLLRGGLRRQLILSVAAVHAVLMALFVWDLTSRQQALLLERQIEEAEALAQTLATSAAGWLAARDVSGLQELAIAQRRYPELTYAMLLDRHGRVLAHTERARIGQYVRDLPDESRLALLTRSSELVDVAAPAMLAGSHVGWARVGIGQHRAQEKLAAITRSGVVYAFVAILVGSLLAAYMGTRLTAKLYTIRRVSEAVRGGRRAARVPGLGDDEAGQLGSDVNAMLDALDTARSALARNEERWVMALEGAGHGVWDWDVEREHVYFSRQWKEMLGYREEEIADTLDEWESRVHPEDRAAWSSDLQRHLRGETPQHIHEHRVRCKDGSYKWVAERGRVVEWVEAGRPRRVIGTRTDITARKEAEQALASAYAQLQALIDSYPGGVVMVNEHGRVVLVNRRFSDLFEIRDAPVLIGEDGRALLARTRDRLEDPEAFTRRTLELIGGREPVLGEELRLRDGRVLERDFVPVFADGRRLGTLWEHRDITARIQGEAERERLQQQLQQAQKMEAIGQLTGGIAHDFNNILTAILGYTELALERFVPEKESELGEYLKAVLVAGERARDLIAKMLAYSRVRPHEDTQPLEPAPLVREVVKMLASSIPASIEITSRIDDVPAILAAPVDLHQIIINLAINARDAVGEHGRIEIELHLREDVEADCVSCHQPIHGDFVEIAVSDTGGGIPADVLPRVFDPFFTTKDVGKGSGLGLSVVEGIVRNADGHILIESRPGSGTRVRLLFPPTTREVAPLPPRSAPAPAGRGGCIMVVDDESAVAGYLSELLSRHGYRVISLHDPYEALQRFDADPQSVDLVITDQTMPGLTGVELARAMLARRPDLAVILSSGYSDQIDAAGAEQLGIRAFVAKPLSGDALLALVAELLKGGERTI